MKTIRQQNKMSLLVLVPALAVAILGCGSGADTPLNMLKNPRDITCPASGVGYMSAREAEEGAGIEGPMAGVRISNAPSSGGTDNGGGHGDSTDSDREAEEYASYIKGKKKEVKKKIKASNETISDAELEKKSFGSNNKHLKGLQTTKNSEVESELADMRNAVSKSRDIVNRGEKYCKELIKCEKCGLEIWLTYHDLEKLAKRYGASFSQYARVLSWERRCHTESGYKFTKCPNCMNRGDLDKYEDEIRENIDEIAKFEATLVTERVRLTDNKDALVTHTRSEKTVARQSTSRQAYRQKANEAEQALAEKEKKAREDLLQTARNLLEKGVPKDVVITCVPGLTAADIIALISSSSSSFSSGGASSSYRDADDQIGPESDEEEREKKEEKEHKE